MITGFNTDIEYKGTTYHVQTEDKGVATPLILSLVYDRGTILASKRSPYDDLLLPQFDEQALSDRLQKQHKLICAAVRAGRIEDLKRMTMKESASRQKGLVAQREIKTVSEISETPAQKASGNSAARRSKARNEEIPLPELLREKNPPNFQSNELDFNSGNKITLEKTAPGIPKPDGEPIWSVPVKVVEETVIDAVQIIEEETILPDEAVEIITDFAKNEQTAPGKLKIELPAGLTFKGGERKTVSILVRRGTAGKGLSGAHIMIKVLGAAFRPLIFHAKTDNNGVATVHLQMPSFRSGRAAIVIKAMSDGDEVEMRRVIRQG